MSQDDFEPLPPLPPELGGPPRGREIDDVEEQERLSLALTAVLVGRPRGDGGSGSSYRNCLPFYGKVLMGSVIHVGRRATSICPTACVWLDQSGVLNLAFNPYLMDRLEKYEVQYVDPDDQETITRLETAQANARAWIVAWYNDLPVPVQRYIERNYQARADAERWLTMAPPKLQPSLRAQLDQAMPPIPPRPQARHKVAVRIDFRQVVAVCVHELLHVVHMHLLILKENLRDPRTANLAMDTAINQYIDDLPDWVITIDYWKKQGLDLEREREWDYYYEKIDEFKKQNPKPPKPPKPPPPTGTWLADGPQAVGPWLASQGVVRAYWMFQPLPGGAAGHYFRSAMDQTGAVAYENGIWHTDTSTNPHGIVLDRDDGTQLEGVFRLSADEQVLEIEIAPVQPPSGFTPPTAGQPLGSSQGAGLQPGDLVQTCQKIEVKNRGGGGGGGEGEDEEKKKRKKRDEPFDGGGDPGPGPGEPSQEEGDEPMPWGSEGDEESEPTTVDDHEPWKRPDKIDEVVTKGWQGKFRDKAQKEGFWGKMPGNMTRTIDDFLKPKVSWKPFLRRFIGDAIRIGVERTRKRPSRRMGWDAPGRKVTRSGRIWVAVDNSGSVTEAEAAQFFGEIDSFVDQIEVVLVVWDTRITSARLITQRGQLMRAARDLGGGGGTDVHVVFQALKNPASLSEPSIRRVLGAQRPNGVLVLTDGDLLWPEEEWDLVPTLWGITREHNLTSPKFGIPIHVKVG